MPYLAYPHQDLRNSLKNLSIWHIPVSYPSFSKQFRSFNVLDLIRGLIPYTLTNVIKQNLNQPSKAYDITIESVDFFITQIYSRIWLERCDVTIQRQESMGLTKKFKLKKQSQTKKTVIQRRSVLNRSSNGVSVLNSNNNSRNDINWIRWVDNLIHFGTDFMRRLDISSSVFLMSSFWYN